MCAGGLTRAPPLPSSSFPPRAGPFAINGVPLRRVNQAYVIATSTKVDVSGVALPAEVNDDFFKAAEEKAKKGEADFFALQAKAEGATEVSAARKALQAKVDGAIKVSGELSAYLKAKFALRKGDKPVSAPAAG